MRPVIFHVDVNSAFLSWEAVYRLHHLGGRLDLRKIPSAVGGDQTKRHGIILAKSIPAKKYRIRTGEPIVDALKKCPELLLVPPNYNLYDRSSRALMEILSRYTDRTEKYSIDEAFLDMTGACKKPEETAVKLRDSIFRELGFTVNIGVSSNKLLAKMASDFKKPHCVHTLWKEEIPEKMWPLPVGNLFYVGHATKNKLARMGIHTIGELARTDPDVLAAFFKSHGILIHQYANGNDASEVIPIAPANKGYGNSTTTPWDVTDDTTAKLFLLSLAETVSARLRNDGAKIQVVSVGIRDYNLQFYHHQITLPVATDLTVEIYAAACKCFDSLWNGLPIRHLGIHTARVVRTEYRQMGLFDTVDYDKQKKAETAVDAIRRKYGNDCVKRASFIDPPDLTGKRIWIDHMSGGISREKRSVDYSRQTIY